MPLADIQKMVKDAEANAAEDKKRLELVEAKNQGESLVHSTEKSLKDYGDKVSAADKSTVEAAVAELGAHRARGVAMLLPQVANAVTVTESPVNELEFPPGAATVPE